MSEKASIKKSTLEIESGGEKMKKGSGVKQKKWTPPNKIAFKVWKNMNFQKVNWA